MADINNSLGINNSGGIWGTITGSIFDQTDLIDYTNDNFYPLNLNPAGYLTSFVEEDPIFTTWLATNPLDNFLTETDADLLYYPLSSNPEGYLTQQEVLEFESLVDIETAYPVGTAGIVYIATNVLTTDIPVYYIWNGSAYVTTTQPVTGVTGSGTTGTHAVWTSPTTLGNSRLRDGIDGGIYTFNAQWINLINGGDILKLNRSQSSMTFTLGVNGALITKVLSSQSQEGLDLASAGDLILSSGGIAGNPTNRLHIARATGNIHIGGGSTAATDKLQVTGDLRLTGAFKDSNNEAGTSGQILSSTATGTDWIDAPASIIVDSIPTDGSSNAVSSNGVFDALSLKLDITTAASSYQPLDSDLTSWAAITRASGFDTFVATPSSANLASLMTDETGTGSLVLANAPTLVNPIVGTQSANDNSGKAASTAYVDTGLALKQPLVDNCFMNHYPVGSYITLNPYVNAVVSTSFSSNAANSNNQCRWQQVITDTVLTIDEVYLSVAGTNAGASATVTLYFYDDANNGLPGTKLQQEISSTGILVTGNKIITFTNNITLQPGVYWVGIHIRDLDTAGLNPTFYFATPGTSQKSYQTSAVTFTNNYAGMMNSNSSSDLVTNPTVSFSSNILLTVPMLKIKTG